MADIDIEGLIKKVLGYSSQGMNVPGQGVSGQGATMSEGGTVTNAPGMSSDLKDAMSRVYGAKYRAGAESALGVAKLVAGREESNALMQQHQLSNDSTMFGHGVTALDAQGKNNILQQGLDWEKKKDPSLPAGSTLGKGVGVNSPSSIFNWNNMGDNEMSYLKKMFGYGG